MSHDPHIDSDLLIRISNGDEAAFREIFHRYGQLVHSHIYSIIKSETPTKDLVQDSFLRVWLHRDKLPEIENFRSWLMRISYNRAFSYLRDKATHEKGSVIYLDRKGGEEQANPAEEHLHLQTLRRIIKNTVDKLPAQQKKIYLLSREEGMKIPEIADQLGLSVSTIKNTLGRALQALRAALESEGFGVLIVLLVLSGS